MKKRFLITPLKTRKTNKNAKSQKSSLNIVMERVLRVSKKNQVAIHK